MAAGAHVRLELKPFHPLHDQSVITLASSRNTTLVASSTSGRVKKLKRDFRPKWRPKRKGASGFICNLGRESD